MARGNPNIRNEGKETRFSSTNQPGDKGRKPRLYTILAVNSAAPTLPISYWPLAISY